MELSMPLLECSSLFVCFFVRLLLRNVVRPFDHLIIQEFAPSVRSFSFLLVVPI